MRYSLFNIEICTLRTYKVPAKPELVKMPDRFPSSLDLYQLIKSQWHDEVV